MRLTTWEFVADDPSGLSKNICAWVEVNLKTREEIQSINMMQHGDHWHGIVFYWAYSTKMYEDE